MNDPPVDPSVDDDHSSLNELQAPHFDSSAVKASNSRPRDRGRPRASPLPTGSSKSFGKHCYKWNDDPNNWGVQLHSRVYRVRLHSAWCCVSSFPTLSYKKIVLQLTIYFSYGSGRFILFKWSFCMAHDFTFSSSGFAQYMFSHATFRHLVPRNGL